MQHMVTFRLNRECRDVAVNPGKVLYVCHYEHGASQIHFSRECFVRVQGSLADVISRIEAALCDGPALHGGANCEAPVEHEGRAN